MEDKPLLRSRLLAARLRRGDAERAAAGRAIAAHGLALWGRPVVVAAYAALPGEPPTRPLLDALRAAGATVLLPRVVGTALHWAVYSGWETLVPGPFGVLAPAADSPPARLDAAQVVLVPALAVDRAGHRLGRGGGYYDRALAGRSHPPAAAVVFADEVVARLPVEPHDVPVSAALTPDGWCPLG